jgi:hypothetical protein
MFYWKSEYFGYTRLIRTCCLLSTTVPSAQSHSVTFP